MFSTGRGDTARRFLVLLGPRRLKRRWASNKEASMRSLPNCILVLFLVFLPLPVVFATDVAPSECTSAGDGTGLSVGYCIADLLKKEDERLSGVYNNLLRILKNMDIPSKGSDGRGVSERSLVEAQRAWIKYRNANCGYYFSLAQGGTAGSLYGVSCQWRMTKERAEELDNEVAFWAGKGY
jgi:uncharacterized protein YecT (DUF1311 family)